MKTQVETLIIVIRQMHSHGIELSAMRSIIEETLKSKAFAGLTLQELCTIIKELY